MNGKHIFLIFFLSSPFKCWALDMSSVIKDPLNADIKMSQKNQQWQEEIFKKTCPISLDTNLQSRQSLTLDNVVDIALCNNYQVKFSWASIKVQAGLVGEAKSAFLPTLNATIGKSHQNTQYYENTFPNSNYQTVTRSANFTWNLFDFGIRKENLESANQLLNAALASYEAVIQKLFSSVTSAYFELMTAEATLDARLQAKILADSTLQNVRRREARGVVAASDSFQASTALAKAELALSRANSDVLKARSTLLYLMAAPLDMPVNLSLNQPAIIDLPLDSLDKWLTDARQWHPAIMAAKAKMNATGAKSRAIAAEGLPKIDFVHTYSQNNYPNQSLSSIDNKVKTTSLNINFPLFEGFSRNYKYKGILAQYEQDEANFKDIESQIMNDVVKAYSDAISAVETIQASQQLLTAAEAAQKSSQKRYDKGAADILELIATQTTLAEAHQERIRSLADWRSARLRLIASTGLLNKSELK